MAFVTADEPRNTGSAGLSEPKGPRWWPLVLRRGLALAGAGVLPGIVAAALAMRLMGALLYEVTPLDRPVFGLAVLTLAVLAAAAILVPALRGARVSPTEVLRIQQGAGSLGSRPGRTWRSGRPHCRVFRVLD